MVILNCADIKICENCVAVNGAVISDHGYVSDNPEQYYIRLSKKFEPDTVFDIAIWYVNFIQAYILYY